MRTRIGKIIAAGAFLATVTTSAHAGKVLWTAPALAQYPSGFGRTIYCDIVNVHTQPQTVTIDILDYYGAVVTTSGPLTLAPETGTAWGDSSFGSARCRFTVSGSTKKVRAFAVYDNGSDYTIQVPAQ